MASYQVCTALQFQVFPIFAFLTSLLQPQPDPMTVFVLSITSGCHTSLLQPQPDPMTVFVLGITSGCYTLLLQPQPDPMAQPDPLAALRFMAEWAARGDEVRRMEKVLVQDDATSEARTKTQV